jgi:hypothetical protein
MCLTSVDSTKSYPKSHIAYKLIQPYSKDKVDISPIRNKNKAIKELSLHPFNEWIKDTKRGSLFAESSSEKYLAGYHLLETLSDVSNFIRTHGWEELSIAKVQFRNVRATGSQYSARVIVAKEIKVLEILYKSYDEYQEAL